jgi:hypothetical protein
MIFDSYEAFRAANFKPKVCILGSGPAGTTIARKLGAAGIPVVVLEAGSREFSDESQDFYRGSTVGDFYFDLDITRLRFMGGSSNHWAGWCRIRAGRSAVPISSPICRRCAISSTFPNSGRMCQSPTTSAGCS